MYQHRYTNANTIFVGLGMKKLYNFWLWAFCGYNFMQGKYNNEWDKRFNELLDQNEFKRITYFHANLGTNKLWIANQPYCCFTIKAEGYQDDDFKIRPSRASIRRGIKILNATIERNRTQEMKIQLSKI